MPYWGVLELRHAGKSPIEAETNARRVLHGLLEHLRYMGIISYRRRENGDLVVEVKKPPHVPKEDWDGGLASERVASFGDKLTLDRRY